MKRRIDRIRFILVLKLSLFLGGLLIISVLPSAAAANALTLSRPSVTPRSGEPDDNYMFLVTYTDSDNTPPEKIQLVVDNLNYDLTPVNVEDDNYIDGKDYMIEIKLSEGLHLFYFKASNNNQSTTTLASPIMIEKTETFTHLDVAYGILIATIIILIPLIYGLYLMKQIATSIKKKGEGEVQKVTNKNQ